jgi:hypothetical protein
MRVSVFRGTPTRPNGHKALQPHEAASAVATSASEALDEQIESLLVSLDEPVEAVQPEEELPAAVENRSAPKRWASGRRKPLRARVNQFDMFFVVTAVLLGFAVGLLTVVLVNS